MMLVARNFVDILFNVLILAILARAMLSWFRIGPDNALGAILFEITEPILAPLRRFIPALGGMIDITPIIALFILQFLKGMILSGLTPY